MEHEGDVLELLQSDELELGCIDVLMNNYNNNMSNYENIINDHQLGFDQAVVANETNNELGINIQEEVEEEFDGILERFKQHSGIINNNEDHVTVRPDLAAATSIPAAADRNLVMSDTMTYTPKKKKMRKTPSAWTDQEQRLFLMALEAGLKGDWKEVSKSYVKTKTPSQITSHAQKYFQRKKNTHKKRKSINDYDELDDDTYDDDHHVNTVNHHHQQHASSSSSSSSNILSMVNYQMMSPQLQVQSDQSTRPLIPPLMSTPMHGHGHGNGNDMMMMPPPMSTPMHGHGHGISNGNGMMMMMPPAAIYIANKCLALEKEINRILNLRRYIIMMMTMPPAGANNASTFGVNQAQQPYVGSSISSHHHDAYYNAPLHDHQGLQPQPLVQQNHPSPSSGR